MQKQKDPELISVLTQIYEDKGIDFTQYKDKTLLRRLDSRCKRLGFSSYNEYKAFLKDNPEEYVPLLDSLFINVTEFFRNKESFDFIDNTIVPKIIENKKDKKHRVIRVWSCACSTGDEPYSLAMLLLEKLGKETDKFTIVVYGTDIDEGALKDAGEGLYEKDRLKAVPEKLMKKYFEQKTDILFQLKKEVVNLVMFRHHDVINDKPIKHCDLILCRNLLIYFNKQLQEETLLKFHQSLNDSGYLILGMVESLVGAASTHFETADNRLRVYKCLKSKKIDLETGNLMDQAEIDRLIKELLN
jgi:chemotaxis methyl-accepting protein methylase